jgi:hypothetical protein
MIAAGESGLPFYNPLYYLRQSSYVWSNELLGGSFPTLAISLPFYLIAGSLYGLGVSGVILQAGTFWIILVTASISTHKLTLQATGGKQIEAIVSGLFFILNPFAVTAIWNRMLYTDMFAYALLPLGLFLFVRGIRTRDMKYTLYLGGATVLFSYAFSSVTFVLVFWTLLLSACFVWCLLNLKERREVFLALRFTIVSGLIFVIANSWWLLPLSTIVAHSSLTTGQSYPQPDLGTLLYFASVNGVSNVVRLIPPNWNQFAEAWGHGLNSPFFIALSFLIPVVSFSAIFARSERKSVVFFGALSVLGLTLANGAAPPIGGAFLFVYERIPFAVLFRNPWEKLGVLYSLAISPLFGIGLLSLYRHVRSLARRKGRHSSHRKFLTIVAPACFPILLSFLIMGVLVWPMWTGAVFEGTSSPNPGDYVSVPAYYSDARQWLMSQGQDFRIIVLPMGGEGTTYVWNEPGENRGFNGVNVDNLLFGVPSISLPGNNALSQNITQIPRFLVSNSTTFWKMMSVLSAKYVVVRDDSNYSNRNQISPLVLKQALEASYSPSILPSGVDLSSSNVTQLYDENRTGSLAPIWSMQASLNFSTNASKQSSYGISFDGQLVSSSSNYLEAGANYFLPTSLQDFSHARFLEVWLNASHPMNVSIGLANHDDSSESWGSPTDTTYSISQAELGNWKLLTLPISSLSSEYNSFDIAKSVNRIGFAFFSAPSKTPIVVNIGGMFLDKGVEHRTPHISYVRSFGPLHVYEIDESLFTPIVYQSTQFAINNSPSQSLQMSFTAPTFTPGKSVALVGSDFKQPSLLSSIDSRNQPQLRVRFIDPTTYGISASNVTGPFILVLNQLFDDRWMPSSMCRSSCTPAPSVEVGPHFLVNGFANGWFVSGKGNLDIVLHFGTQDLLVYGFWISFVSLFLLIFMIGISRRSFAITSFITRLRQGLGLAKRRSNTRSEIV